MSAPVIIGNATHIYALCDGVGNVRYVGKTVSSPEKRFAQHKTRARRSELPVARWLRKTPDASVRLIETVPSGADWASREAHWIKHYSNLLNLTAGGEGLAGHKFSPEHRQKIAAALQKAAPVVCDCCGVSFSRKPFHQSGKAHQFCSPACYFEWQRGKPKYVPAENQRRMMEAAAAMRRAQTHCKRGHPLSGDNLFITSQGSRGCKECRKLHKVTYRSKANG